MPLTPASTYADLNSRLRANPDLTSKAVDEKDIENLTVQRDLAEAWDGLTSGPDALFPKAACDVSVLGSIEQAIQDVVAVSDDATPTDVLVTGSLHLVGGVMAVAKLPVS